MGAASDGEPARDGPEQLLGKIASTDEAGDGGDGGLPLCNVSKDNDA